MAQWSIDECRVEHLRGYSDTAITFSNFMVLIGDNNEGKSSLLKMIDFLFDPVRASDPLLQGERALTIEELRFWLPANDSKHRARRLTLFVRVDDGRVARRYRAQQNDRIQLRFSITVTNRLARLNLGAPTQGEAFEPRALELLKVLRNEIAFELVPAVREVSSSRFGNALARRVDEDIARKLRHSQQGGAPTEYRQALDVIELLNKIVTHNTQSLAFNPNFSLLRAMLRDTEIRLDTGIEDIIQVISKGLRLFVCTGEHDVSKVLPTEVGNGLQSILDIALTLDQHGSASDKRLFLVVEEPEAFLHPSAQRQLAIALQDVAEHRGRQVVITTHSPVILDECRFEHTVLARDQRFFIPMQTDARRNEINSTLLSVPHAECFFARAVLLVEGPGDKAVFDTLLRRLRRLPAGTALSRIVVQPTGGKTRFAPWINLFRAYGQEGHRPIQWLCLLDADAASRVDGERAVIRALRDGGYQLPHELVQRVTDLGDSAYGDPAARIALAHQANQELSPVFCHLFSIDLEWALLSGEEGSVRETLRAIRDDIDISLDGTMAEIARRLGSKVINGVPGATPKKDPFVRAKIARDLPFELLSSEIENVLRKIVGYVLQEDCVDTLFEQAKQQNPGLTV